MKALTQRLADVLREARIEALTQQCVEESDPAKRRGLWMKVRAEINARSPQQVDRMERARELR